MNTSRLLIVGKIERVTRIHQALIWASLASELLQENHKISTNYNIPYFQEKSAFLLKFINLKLYF